MRNISNRVIIIKNPRRIPVAMDSYAALTGVDVCYVRGTNQLGSSNVINGIISTLADDTLVGVISDDTVLTDDIVDAVFGAADEYEEPASGWVRIFDGQGDASVTTEPLRIDMMPAKSLAEYSFLTYDDMSSRTGIVPAFFSGMALHTMSAAMWREFPAQVHRPDVGGGQSDLHMAQRIHAAGLHINVVAEAEIQHLKIPKAVAPTQPRPRRQRRLAAPTKHKFFLGPQHEEIVWNLRSEA